MFKSFMLISHKTDQNGFRKSRYPRLSSISRWEFSMKQTIQLLGYPHGHENPQINTAMAPASLRDCVARCRPPGFLDGDGFKPPPSAEITNIYIYTYTYTYIHIHIHIHIQIHTYIYTYTYTLRIYIYTYKCACTDMHRHMHTHIYTHTHIHYITLHYTTLHYITLHYITLHYITYNTYTTLHYITLQYMT